MAIFPRVIIEEKIQVDDKTRLDATTSFITDDEAAITLLRIKPSAADSFIDVTTNLKLDWAYSTDGTKTVTVEITTDGAPVTKDFTIESITEVDDCLFSNDKHLVAYEGEILKYVRKGRNSWLDKHRAAQERIIEFLDENEIWKCTEDSTVPVPYTKTDICALTGDNFEQFKDWSRFMVLEMIYFDMKKQVDDVFTEKFIAYKRKRIAASNRSVLRLDKDSNGVITADEFEFKNQGRIIRR